ncbi:MAG: ThuA domain-containing protein [Planctomycetota bacterium]|jgi:type 1 glutamine amidotransferase
MKCTRLLIALILTLACLDGRASEPLRVFIRAGVKTHGPGAHDHPRFLKEWKQLLNERGAATDGALEFPTAKQLEATDVLVMYAANAGDIDPAQRQGLDRFFQRGGGIVVIHDAVCGHDPQWFKTITGGAWEHKHSRFRHGEMTLNYTDTSHPVTRGAASFTFPDEIYWDLRMMPQSRVLAESPTENGQTAPQLWAYERGNARAFGAIPGHYHVTFSQPQYRAILLRGIAWAGKRDVDLLTRPHERDAVSTPPPALPLPPEVLEDIAMKKAKKEAAALRKAARQATDKPAPAPVVAAQKAPPQRKKPEPPVYTGPPREFPWGDGTRVLIVGGNKAHDFDRWFNTEDVSILSRGGKNSVFYTDHVVDILPALDKIDVLYLSNNQPIPDSATRRAILGFADRGKGLVLAHAALWYNWKDWPEYNRDLVGGGTRKHDKLGRFAVDVHRPDHPVMKGVPRSFELKDELYQYNVDPEGAPIEVLSSATSPVSGVTYPSTFIVQHPRARIVAITLGHDGDCHELPAFRKMLQNAVDWAAGNGLGETP